MVRVQRLKSVGYFARTEEKIHVRQILEAELEVSDLKVDQDNDGKNIKN